MPFWEVEFEYKCHGKMVVPARDWDEAADKVTTRFSPMELHVHTKDDDVVILGIEKVGDE